MAEKKTEAAEKKTVKVRLPLTRTLKDDKYVAINGKTWLIKRGVDVEVPLAVAEVLEHSEEMLAKAMEAELAAAAPLEALMK